MSRERITRGATDLLNSGKYSSLTVDALARSLRMSKSTLYKYFPSKEDVVIAIVDDACALAEEELTATLAGGTASAQIKELAGIIGRHGSRLPRAVLTQPERLPSACLVRLQDTRAAFSSGAQVILERGVSSGEFVHPEPHVVAIAFVASALEVLADGARSGAENYGESLHHLPALFLPAITK